MKTKNRPLTPIRPIQPLLTRRPHPLKRPEGMAICPDGHPTWAELLGER
ncbi:hypothetical protein KBY66_02460 [Synechococcus sp. Tobar12-5m-g]|jgi:hypothetical protein|nr:MULTISPECIES: hypothetical protein [unclassified Synechococcus]MCP9771497.1 hypothetical protein [Synechococcus sp. Tobar12-5m-g]MCP9872436.1 hypothetical protein [Synechococcus sp. Cruz CV-v-12]